MSIRVAYILSSTIPNGGATKAFLSLLNGIMPLGVEPIVIVPDREGIYPMLQRRGIPVYSFKYRMNTYPHFRTLKQVLLFLPRLAARRIVNRIATQKLKKLFIKYDIQLIHTNVSVIAIGQKAAHSLGIPHIYHFREYADLDFGHHYFPTKTAFHRSITSEKDYYICITRKISEHHHLTDNRRTRVIYDGIKPQQKSFPLVSKQSFLLYAGRIQATKGLTDLLEAYALSIMSSKTPVLDLKVAGSNSDKDYFHQVQQIISKYDIGDRVEFLGERDDIEQLMQQANALIVPSRFEGFGLCMPEAMFNGCVVVGYNNAGTKEQFENGNKVMNGEEIGFPYNTSQELTDIIIKVSSTPSIKFDDMRKRAFSIVNQLYTIEKNVNDVYSFYEYILS